MFKAGKFNVKFGIIFFSFILLTFFPFGSKSYAASFSAYHQLFLTDTVPIFPTAVKDTLKPAIKNEKTDSLAIKKDTIQFSKDSLQFPIKYAAKDSGVLWIQKKEFILYGSAEANSKDMELKAAVIRYDQEKNVLKAMGSSDTAANSLKKTLFVQQGMQSRSDSIAFNLKSQKGLSYNSFFQEGDLFVNAYKIKKADSNIVYAYKGAFTTCNLDTPHFAFRTKKLKLINKKIGFSGPIHPEIEGVPIPLYAPFGIYPLSSGRKTGMMMPTFTNSPNYGLGLEGLGYYYVVNPYADITFRANIYTYGGWYFSVEPRYFKRYKYNGTFKFTKQYNRTLNTTAVKSLDEFTTNSSYMINWYHNKDGKARPGTNFSANVNFGSTKFNRYILNNVYANYNNQLNSAISYKKSWQKGKYNLSLNLNSNQNSNTNTVNLSLPNGSFTMNTIYPLQPKESVGSAKWYQKFSIGLNTNFMNSISYYDSSITLKRLLDTARWGAQVEVPLGLVLPALGPIIVTPGISFRQRWFGQQIIRTWNPTTQSLETNIKKGFFLQSDISFSIGANTSIFGTVNFKKGAIKAIRHILKPTINLSYKPDWAGKDYYSVQVDTAGQQRLFSKYEGAIYTPFSSGRSGTMGFGITNILEMKVKSKKDTSEGGIKKVTLIENFGISSGYNFLADSCKLQNFNLTLNTTLFKKLTIGVNATFDPYQADKYGTRINKLWIEKGSLGKFSNFNINASTNFSSKPRDEKMAKNTANNQFPNDPFISPDQQERMRQYIQHNPAQFTDFNIPWNINLSYSFGINRIIKSDYSGYTTNTTSNLNLTGDFSLSPKWKIGATSYMDVKALNISVLTFFLSREMHCWQLSINVTPIGLYPSFNFTLSPKSGILRDLKVNRTRTFSN